MIETEDYKAVYDCDGTTVRFDFTFQITQESDLDVKRYDSVGLDEDTLILGSDYTMEQATVGTWLDGGTVVTTTAYITNDRISLTRDVPSTQLLDYVENDPFPAESHEGGLDKLTILAQQAEEILSRVMTFPKSDPVGIDNELAPLEARLGKIIQFDLVTGEPNLVQAVSTGTVTFTAWGELWVANSDASDGLDQLGFSAFVKTLVADADASARLTQLGFSAFAETLVGDADASARLTQLGFSAYIETLIDAANAAAARAILETGLGQGLVANGTNMDVDGIVEENGAELKFKTVDIGNWDMQANGSVNVAHGLAEEQNIRTYDIIIRTDAGSTVYPLDRYNAGNMDGGVQSIDGTNFSLARRAGGVFDGIIFNEPAYNRGWITIGYAV